jgi:arsenite-transporting ATPase
MKECIDCGYLADQNGMMGSMMQDLAFAIPGVDEAMSFAEIMKCAFFFKHVTLCNSFADRQVKSMEFSVIVFDTAPTGHTLRFLSFPTVLEKALGKLSQLSGQFGPMIKQVSPEFGPQDVWCDIYYVQMSTMMGGQQDAQEDMFAKLESMRSVITEVNTQFKDPVRLYPLPISLFCCSVLVKSTGEDDIRMRVHFRVFVTVRNGTPCSRIDNIRDRYT